MRASVSETLFNKYKRFLNNAMVDLDPNLRWCPEPSCDSYVRKVNGTKETQCRSCDTWVCFDCGEVAHIGRECGQSKEDEDFERWKKDNGAVKCPKCTIVVYKFEGCNHMTCSGC